jgi:hypothetical protein
MSHPCVDVLRGSQQMSLDCNSAHVDLRSLFTAWWLGDMGTLVVCAGS